jgi:hypothetical protein
MKQKDIITPISMISNNTEEVIHLSKRLTNVENLLTAFMKKDDNNLRRCLEIIFFLHNMVTLLTNICQFLFNNLYPYL